METSKKNLESMNLPELRKERHHIAAKISSWKKAGKDVTELKKQEEQIKLQIIKYKQDTIKSTKVLKHHIQTVRTQEPAITPKKVVQPKTKPVISKSWSKADLDICKKQVDQILDNNDWCDGYQFRSSEWMSIKNISTRVLPDSVELTYTIQYRTKNRRVEKVVTKYFNPDTVQGINKYIEQVELWVMLNSGDMDDKSIVFGARFNRVQFDASGMAEQGWVIKK